VAVFAGALLIAASLGQPAVSRIHGATQITIVPVEDARVKEAEPAKNFGNDGLLHARTYPSQGQRSYLRFVVSGLLSPPDSVHLRLFNTDPSPDGGTIRTVLGSWAESSVTWATSPGLGTALASLGNVTAGSWADVDLTDFVTGNGTFNLGLDSAIGNLAAYSSSEGANPPQLVILGGGEPGPPVADFAASPVLGAAPLDVAFTSLASGQPATWEWDFDGDGLTDSTARNPRHLFTSPGSYDVTLTVSNAVGADTLTRAGYVHVTTDAVLVGAGDIADCTETEDEATASLVDQIGGIVFTAGDNAYPHGSAADFAGCYAPTWGRHLARTRPSPGNHDYETAGAAGYFGYFGGAAGPPGRGYYAYDLGSWRIIVLDSNCSLVAGGCGVGSPQEVWLRSELAAHAASNVLAMWHHPRFNSGSEHGSDPEVAPFWDALYEYGADLVINGHEHVYERFGPQTPQAAPDAQYGIRQITIGTGGADLYSFLSPLPNSQVRYNGSAGVLKLTLGTTSYSWQFVPIAGATFSDSGTGAIHGAPPPSAQLTHVPVSADVRVKEAQPSKNFGADPTLQVRLRSGQSHRSYLAFNVSGLAQPPASVRLRLFTTDSSSDGGTLYRVTTPWAENTVTWNSQPLREATPLAQVGPVVAGSWAEVDLTGVVTGNGTYSWVLISDSNNAAIFSSSEGSLSPELVIDPGS
jgi:PKD repeat protein